MDRIIQTHFIIGGLIRNEDRRLQNPFQITNPALIFSSVLFRCMILKILAPVPLSGRLGVRILAYSSVSTSQPAAHTLRIRLSVRHVRRVILKNMHSCFPQLSVLFYFTLFPVRKKDVFSACTFREDR